MSYTVDWSDDALDSLADIWTQSADRRAVTDVSTAPDRLLAANPLVNGTPLSEGLWAIEVHPLRALYEVHANRSVKVVAVKELP
ncbi:MAG TPA: type II toxin-antitoxin system RelE/ParE family toxin [Gemmataceae bacterium]|nr:type II toxin-antitoxin system RelE/ParE family toxin [Gemmataceae bacterium]